MKSNDRQEAPGSLTAALAQADMQLGAVEVSKLGAYCDALWEWNRRLNLTRHTDFARFVNRDVLDSVQLASHLQSGEKVLDVGSGGGVPGVILAILRPDLHVTLCESVQKKAHALTEITKTVGLPIPVHHARAEILLEELRFETLTIRAVGPLYKLLKWFAPCWSSFDRMVLIKGPKWVQERGEARHLGLMNDLSLRRLATYTSLDSDAESHILTIRQKIRE